MSLSLLLLLSSIIIFLCILLNKTANKIGVPMLLAFIILGMLFGSEGFLGIEFSNFKLAETLCSAALIVIIFYGGFGTKWSAAKPVANKSIILSTLGVILTALFVACFCRLVLKIPFIESFLIGSVISSTDAASVFSILRSKQLNLKYNTASILEVESGSNDPCSYMMTIIALSLMGGNLSAGRLVFTIFAQITFGIGLGVVISLAALAFLRRFHFPSAGFDSLFVLAVGILSYAMPSLIGGNGYLSAYIAGIILGNSSFPQKKNLAGFFDGILGLMQVLIFFLLGLLCYPSKMIGLILPSIAIALFLTFVARPIAVSLLLTPFKCPLKQQLLISWTGLRGAASIVFAIMAITNPNYQGHDVFHIVFCIVLFSIALQGSLIPFVAKKLDMTDKNANVLKTFTDYPEEVPVQFIKLNVGLFHPWIDKKLSEIVLPPETIVAFIVRDEKRVVPRGQTVIEKEDILVLCARNFSATNRAEQFVLNEICIDENHRWKGKQLFELKAETSKMLIVLIKRGDMIIIPEGKTDLQVGDILVIETE